MNFKIKFKECALNHIDKIPKVFLSTIKKAIDERLTTNPYRFKPLRGKYKGFYRMRVGDYRIIYEIKNNELIVIIIAIGNRKNVYE